MGSPINLVSVLLLAILIYLMWMDVGLYLELQKTPSRVQQFQSNTTTEKYVFSPFKPVTVKLLVLSATIQFIDEPLGYFLVSHSNIATIFSANMISCLGVVVALFSARFFSSESITRRRIGVLIFKFRDFLDALDGNIAREVNSAHAAGHIANPMSWGWMIDGTCDGLADIIRFLAFAAFLQKLWSNGKSNGKANISSYSNISGYSLLDTKLNIDVCARLPGVSETVRENKIFVWFYQLWLKYRTAMKVVMWVGFQSLFSGVLWNAFMINYHTILETNMEDTLKGPINLTALAKTQNQILKSSSMWMICYFWRLANPQNLGQIQLVAVLFGKEAELLTSIQLFGYLPLALLGVVSYIHLSTSTSMVVAAALS